MNTLFILAGLLGVSGAGQWMQGIGETDELNRLNQRVYALYVAGEYSAALPLAEQAVKLSEKTSYVSSVVRTVAIANLGELYRVMGNYAAAEPLLQTALSIQERTLGEMNRGTATSVNNLGRLYRDKGEFIKAEQLYRRALEIREKILQPEDDQIAQSLTNLGALLYAKGDYEQAEPLMLRALEIHRKTLGDQALGTATGLDNLAELYRAKGDYARAEPLYLQALAIFQATADPETTLRATVADNLAQLYRDKGDYTRAEPLCRSALEIREKELGSENRETAWSLNNLALIYRLQGAFKEAEPLFRRSLAISEKVSGPDHPETARPLSNLAELLAAQGNYDQAEPLYKKALEIEIKALGAEHPDSANAMNRLALLYVHKGAYGQAEPLLKQALNINEKVLGTNTPTTATALFNLGSLYWLEGSQGLTEEYLSRSGEASERSLASILATGSEEQKQIYLSTFEISTAATLNFHAQYAPSDRAARRLALLTVLRRKGRLLEVMAGEMGALRHLSEPDIRKLLDELERTRTLHANMIMRGPDARTLADYHSEIQNLKMREEQLEETISFRSAAFRVQTEPVTIETVQQAVPADAALIELMSYWPIEPKNATASKPLAPQRYSAYVLFHEGEPEWADLGEAEAINQLAIKLRTALSSSGADVNNLASQLDAKVMKPIRKLLAGKTQLLVSPDGQLNLVPFEALVDESGHYLVERYTFTYLGSGRDLLRLRTQTDSRQGPIVVADPNFNAQVSTEGFAVKAEVLRSPSFNLQFGPLSGTAQEAKKLEELLKLPKEAVLTHEEASKGAVKALTGPRLLHIATHGFFLADQPAAVPNTSRTWLTPDSVNEGSGVSIPRAENPLLRSGLALAGANGGIQGNREDGLLTAMEASGLDLWGTQLVVLSACDTGVGEVANGEGVYGLRRALVMAGSRAQIMSLWSVSDAATPDLMVGFYERLLNGERKSDALREIQLKMLASQEWSRPTYWAPFILSGDGGPLGK